MPKKTHPADAADRALVAKAVEFTAFLRLGARKKIVERAATMAEACAHAARIETEHPGKRAMIYAVTGAGQSVLVPADMIAGAKAPAPAEKPAKAARKAKKAAKARLPASKAERAPRPAAGGRAAILAAAQAGTLPPVPDFSAATHARFRGKLDQVVAMVKARDVAGLKGFTVNPISTSPKAIARYRDLAIVALEANSA